METLLDTGKYSDLTLRCHEKTWKVHRALLCTSSSVIAAAVDGGFREAENQSINLPDDEPEIVEKMLRFLYQKDYDDERGGLYALPSEKLASSDPEVAKPSPAFEPFRAPVASSWDFEVDREELSEVPKIPDWSGKSLLINVKVYVIADKNNIGALKRRATEKYAEVVKHVWNSPSFPASAKLLYDNTVQSDRLLRDVIAETTKKNIKSLIYKQDFEDMMVSHGELAVDVLKSVLLREGDMDFNNGYGYGAKTNKKKASRGFGGF